MGPELIYKAEQERISPWREAMPRMRAYLKAAGFDAPEQQAAIIAGIEARLNSRKPLRKDDDPVKMAMAATVQWVEEQQAAADAGLPEAVPLSTAMPMPEQPISLRRLLGWRGRRGQALRKPDPGQVPPEPPDAAGRGPARGILARRLLFASLIVTTTGGAIALLSGSVQQDGMSPLELLLVVLYAVLFAWICHAFWTAFIGFIIRFFRIRRWDLEAAAAVNHASTTRPRTALIMPVFNEQPGFVFARLRAIQESLLATDAGADFDLFILSDTRDPDIQVEEELEWRRLCETTGCGGRIFYRNRRDNRYRKAGNIAEFVRNWGGRYRYMAVLDADSLMEGRTLTRMVDIMEAQPRVAILQAPPVPVMNHSLFARILQFGAALYGPLYSAGANFWQAGDASYFGHNALLRVEPFARHCGLPSLPGREPFGGPILSHDFVEAAALRRAGWEVWQAHRLEGSFEEVPPTLIDYAKRDRRWCQGNLQHARLIAARGWRGLSRLHFGMAVMSYLASPLWFLFLLAAGVEAWVQSRETPHYFFGDSLFPRWPVSYAFELMTVLLVTLTILFLPKVLALLLLIRERRRREQFGGALRATASAILESLFSVILAPVLMVFQTKFVVAILLKRNVGWPTQQRVDRMTTLGEAVAAHGSQLLLGLAAGFVAWTYVPDFFWWFTPVLAGLVLAVPVSMVTSRADAGLAAARLGLFLSPSEVAPEPVVSRYRELLRQPAPLPPRPAWLWAALNPRGYALHRRMLSPEEPSRRQRLHSDGLMYTLIDQGENALEPRECRELIANAICLRNIHIGLWSELPLQRLASTG